MGRSRRHPGNIKRRGKGFRIRLCVGGKYHQFTLRTLDRREAEQFSRSRHAELERQVERQELGFPGPLHVSELLRRFESEQLPTLSPGCQRSYRESLKVIRAYFVIDRRDPTLDLVRTESVESFLSWRRVRPLRGDVVSNRTLAKDRAVLHRLFADAERLEFVPSNPVARTKPPKGDERTPVILTSAEYDALIAACDDPMLRLYVVVLGETGMRCESEALWLTWEDVDLEDGFITVTSGRNGHRTKSGKSRHVPMTARLQAAMRNHFATYRFAAYNGQRSDWVFHHGRTLRHHVAGGRIGSLRNGFEAAARRAKLPEALHQHDLRHRRVTTWLADGQNPVHVKEALGHSDLRTTMDYTHLAKEHLRALVERPGSSTPTERITSRR